jgi:hypothetical protein
MTVPKRHLRRRVAAVGVATALLVLGLETPAFAVTTVTSFTPTSGGVGCAVTITGTDFTGATAVEFDLTHTASFVVNSATQITAIVPATATDGPIEVTAPGGTDASAGNFDVTGAVCPTITSFTPTSGPAGTSVTITGTNFTGATSVTFNNVTATFTVNSVTQITATVPTTATTGKIKVTTPGGSATSTADFTVSKVHSRSVTLRLKRHLIAQGTVSVADAFTACASSVPVKIQRRVSGNWKTVGSATTSATGTYKKKIKDKAGKYRAKAPKVVLNSNVDICSGAKSPARKHNH